MTVDEVANKTKEEGGRRSRRSRQVEANAQPAVTGQTRKDRPTPARRESGGSRGNIVTRAVRAVIDYFTSTRAMNRFLTGSRIWSYHAAHTPSQPKKRLMYCNF